MPDSSAAEKITELARDIRIAMLSTVDQDGHLTARPMAQQEVEENGDLWFFAEADSPTVSNLAARPQAGVTLSSNDTWISLSGTAKVVHDVDKAKKLWNPWVEAWLPQGAEDPSVVLIKFESEGGEYWDTPGGRVASLLSFAKSTLTGNRYEGGESGTARL